MVGMVGEEMTSTVLLTEVVVVVPNKDILVGEVGRKQTRGMGRELQSSIQHCTVGSPTGYWRAGWWWPWTLRPIPADRSLAEQYAGGWGGWIQLEPLEDVGEVADPVPKH